MTAPLSATHRSPNFVLGIRCDESMIFDLCYLPASTRDVPAQNCLADECCRQLQAYFAGDKKTAFDLPLAPAKTAHAERVRRAMQAIPYGQVASYGEIARAVRSSPRAVGGACRANTHALLVPCHRVVAANGPGGFMGSDGVHQMGIKHYLLAHEKAHP